MNEILEKIESSVRSSSLAKSVTTAVITFGVVAVVIFGNIQVTIGG